jgi:hypothetical protein
LSCSNYFLGISAFLPEGLKKLQKYLEKVEFWNPSVFGLLSSDQIIKENFQCGAIADNHIIFMYIRFLTRRLKKASKLSRKS